MRNVLHPMTNFARNTSLSNRKEKWTYVRMNRWDYVLGFTRTKTIIFFDNGKQKDITEPFDYNRCQKYAEQGLWPICEEPFELWVRRIRSEHGTLQEMSGTKS